MDFPRVTEILKPFAGYEYIPTKILDKAAARGTTVHAHCAGLAKGQWIPEGIIDPEHVGYVRSFKQWNEAQVSKYIIIEKRFTDEQLMFTGQLDFVVLGTDDEFYLVDLKTCAKPQKTHAVQMGAYDLLLKKNDVKVKAALLVYLNREGHFPDITIIEDLQAERNVFVSALNCWHYFNKGKKGKKNGKTDTEHLSTHLESDGGS